MKARIMKILVPVVFTSLLTALTYPLTAVTHHFHATINLDDLREKAVSLANTIDVPRMYVHEGKSSERGWQASGICDRNGDLTNL